VKIEPFGPLDPSLYRETVRRALAEDLGWGDVTTEAAVPGAQRARGALIVDADCVLAGLDIAIEAFRQLDPGVRVDARCDDGTSCVAGETVAALEGHAQAMLTAERVALNFVQHLSAVATLTRRYVEAVGSGSRLLDTRKTVPLHRTLQKYAVRAGGATNHRMALDDGVLIKMNHVRVAGSLTEALQRIRIAQPELPVQVEVRSISEVEEALAAGATRLVAVDFTDDELQEVVRRTRGRAQVEVSGRITLDRAAAVAATGADFVSVGALTHSAVWIDMHFELWPLP
jgi:nicotinate-nucleotide pyrophosphorylase (carboxylating)